MENNLPYDTKMSAFLGVMNKSPMKQLYQQAEAKYKQTLYLNSRRNHHEELNETEQLDFIKFLGNFGSNSR